MNLGHVFVLSALSLAAFSSSSAGEEGLAREASRDDLIAAISERDVRLVDIILESNPALVDSEVRPGVSALLLSVFSKRPGAPFLRPESNELVAALLRHDPRLGPFEAAVLGRCGRLSEMVEEDPELVTSSAPSGWTLLHFAAFSGSVECVRELLDHGARLDVRASQSSKITPLQAGLLTGRFEVARLLVERGADVLVRAARGYTPLHEAVLVDDDRLIRLFVENGAELESKTDECKSPLALAVERGKERAAAALRAAGAVE